jgi:hypothetical protein
MVSEVSVGELHPHSYNIAHLTVGGAADSAVSMPDEGLNSVSYYVLNQYEYVIKAYLQGSKTDPRLRKVGSYNPLILEFAH